jgi:hypothetical protein
MAKCQCGIVTGVTCSASPAPVLVEYMPEDLRASHAAADNSGSYPHNGAIRFRVSEECADELMAWHWGWISTVCRE